MATTPLHKITDAELVTAGKRATMPGQQEFAQRTSVLKEFVRRLDGQVKANRKKATAPTVNMAPPVQGSDV